MNKKIKETYIYVTKDCNLSCKYCAQKHTRNYIISSEVIKKIFKNIIVKDLLTIDNRINIYGGEPFLYFEKVRQILEEISIKANLYDINIDVSIATNGILIDEKIINYILNYLNKNPKVIIHIVFSIDGDYFLTNLNRGITKKQFDKIISNIYLLSNKNIKNLLIEVSSVIPLNPKKIDFKKSMNFLFNLPVDKYLFILEQDINKNYIKNNLNNIYKVVLERIFILKKIFFSLRKEKNIQFSSLGTEFILSIKPNGDIYNIVCPDFLGLENYRNKFFLGNVIKDDFSYNDILFYIQKYNIYEVWEKDFDNFIYNKLFKTKFEKLYKLFSLLQKLNMKRKIG